MEDFKNVVIGSMNTGAFLGYLFIACFTALLVLANRANKKRKTSINTPDNFNLKFMFLDNALSLFLQLGVIILGIRFSNEMIGQEATGWVSAIIGFGSNKFSLIIEKLQNTARNGDE